MQAVVQGYNIIQHYDLLQGLANVGNPDPASIRSRDSQSKVHGAVPKPCFMQEVAASHGRLFIHCEACSMFAATIASSKEDMPSPPCLHGDSTSGYTYSTYSRVYESITPWHTTSPSHLEQQKSAFQRYLAKVVHEQTETLHTSI